MSIRDNYSMYYTSSPYIIVSRERERDWGRGEGEEEGEGRGREGE